MKLPEANDYVNVGDLSSNFEVIDEEIAKCAYKSHTHTPAAIGAAPAPIISQTDITAGSTALETGRSYHVYE